MSQEQVNQMADEVLLARISQGDEMALASFYDRSAPVLYSIAKRILQDASLAEDIVQEVYTCIWQKAGLFDPNLGKPINWAITLTRNRALDRLRSIKRFDQAVDMLALEHEAQAGSSKPRYERVELWQLAQAALRELPEAQRRAVELAFVEGLAHAEVAARLEQPLGTVKAWIRRGLLKIRERLLENGIAQG